MCNKPLKNYRYRGEVGQDTDTANKRKGKEKKGKERKRGELGGRRKILPGRREKRESISCVDTDRGYLEIMKRKALRE